MGRLSGWTLFTLRGVGVNLHFSLLFLLFYVLVIATVQFPLVVESSGVNLNEVGGTPLLWGILFAVSLVVSIFVHEFGHVLMAQKLGAKAKRITLMMLGGVSEMDHVPESPSAEFKVAIVGPLVSLAIAALLFGLRAVTDNANLALYGYWVGQLNLVLGIFNLLPAFPTDGGRVLRAWLVSRQGRLRGTRNAVKVSQFLAWGFGLLGILQFNIFLILIAFFVYQAAKGELFFMSARLLLKGMKVSEIMTASPAVPETASLSEAAAVMIASQKTVLPIETKNPPAGVLSIEQLGSIPRELWPQTLIREMEFERPTAIHTEQELPETLESLFSSSARGVAVTDETGRIRGLLLAADVIRAIQLKELSHVERTEQFRRNIPAWNT